MNQKCAMDSADGRAKVRPLQKSEVDAKIKAKTSSSQEAAPLPPSERRPELRIPSQLDALALWMLEKEPGARPASMAVVAQQLEAAFKEIRGAPDRRKLSVKGVERGDRQQALGVDQQADAAQVAETNLFPPIYLACVDSPACGALETILGPQQLERWTGLVSQNEVESPPI